MTGKVFWFTRPDAERNADRAAGTARLGGTWRTPDYVESYLRASRALVDHAVAADELDELALPNFYLQRHTFELVLKDLLRSLYELGDMDQRLADAEQNARAIFHPSVGARDRVEQSHDLTQLLRDLEQALIGMGYGASALPPELRQLVATIVRLEAGFESRSRYPRVGRRGAPLQHSFPATVEIPNRALQDGLERVVDTLFAVSQANAPQSASLGEDLALEGDDLTQKLHALGAL
jgi:hypothetical protein